MTTDEVKIEVDNWIQWKIESKIIEIESLVRLGTLIPFRERERNIEQIYQLKQLLIYLESRK